MLPWAILPLAVVLVSLAEFRVFGMAHKERLPEVAEMSMMIAAGAGDMSAFANRLLGPFLVWALSHVMTPVAAVKAIMLGGLLAANALLALAFRRVTPLIVFGFLLLAIQFRYFYPWDWLDIVIFIAFIQWRHSWAAVPLFTIALLNKESALFIALWMALDGFLGDRSIARASLGVALLIAGAAFVWVLRMNTGAGEGFGNFIMPLYNAKLFAQSIQSLHSLIVPLFLVAAAGYLAMQVRRDAPLALTGLAVLASIAVTGLIYEARVYSTLLPFLLFLREENRQRVIE